MESNMSLAALAIKEIEYKQRRFEYTIYGEQEQQQAKVVEAKLLQPAGARAPARPKQKRGPVPMTHPWRLFDFTENSMLARERRGDFASCASR